MKEQFIKSCGLCPVPIVMISCGKYTENEKNIITLAWTGIISSEPHMLYISIRKSRYSYDIIKKSGEFVVNIPNSKLLYETDYCGVNSGRDIDKFKELGLTAVKAKSINSYIIGECPINIECSVKNIVELGSHDMFISEILNTHIDKCYLDENDKFDPNKLKSMSYCNKKYFEIGKILDCFGNSIKK